MSRRDEFIHWYFNEFLFDDLYLEMDMTTEDSPWHRELTIGVHTNMVVTQYIARSHVDWTQEELNGAFAAAFHDVGKPPAMEICFREDRGEYKRFAGHELVSARLWEDWSVRNWTMLHDRFGMSMTDMYMVGFVIEHHLPWGLKNRDKRNNLMLTLMNYNMERPFIDHLMADTLGRMSDDSDDKISSAEDWTEQFWRDVTGLQEHTVLYDTANPHEKPVLYVPIGASGSGKTTIRKWLEDSLVDLPLNTFSLDLMRLELYGEPYDEAFLKSTKDKHFRSAGNERYRETLRKKENIYLDNTNTSRKNRRYYITEARNYGYHIHAILLPIQLQTIIDRQKTREDKEVPADAVRHQYMSLSLPQLGEFDSIHVHANNLS